jgi:hypothetical protein
VGKHIKAARRAVDERLKKPHPKTIAVIHAIRQCVEMNEKVLVFCHHHATACELLHALESDGRLKLDANALDNSPPEDVWRGAWKSLADSQNWSELGLEHDDRDFESNKEKNEGLLQPIIDWLCTPGLRAQVGSWINVSTDTGKNLVDQLTKSRPRFIKEKSVPTISESAKNLVEALLDPQSASTRAVLRSMQKDSKAFVGQFPGRLDKRLRVMGAWKQNEGDRPETLYNAEQPDMVVKVFNSPFGPDVLVATDRLSEGIDLHRCCRHLIHYELDPSPVRTLQRNGRVRRVGSWASLTNQPIEYAFPLFGGTRDEKAVGIMKQRLDAFGLLLGGVPTLVDESETDNFVEKVLNTARPKLEPLNRLLSKFDDQ